MSFLNAATRAFFIGLLAALAFALPAYAITHQVILPWVAVGVAFGNAIATGVRAQWKLLEPFHATIVVASILSCAIAVILITSGE
jgi:hypothetical protein